MVQAQKVLIEEEPPQDTIKENFGPNLKNFSHMYIGYGTFWGKENTGAEIRNLQSYYLTIGGRSKYRINDFYSLGFEISFSNYTYRLKQLYNKQLPDNRIHKRERLSFNYINLGLYNRINFYKRGNVLGAYLDLGAEGGFCFSFVHSYYDKTDAGNIRTRVRKLDYYAPFYYSAFARLGYDRLTISCSYRFSHLFKTAYNYPDLPPITLSMQIGLY